MGKRLKKGQDTRTNLPEEDTLTGQASSLSIGERDAFMVEPYHELDPDGDLVLVLDSSSLGSKKVLPDARHLQPGCTDNFTTTLSQAESENPSQDDWFSFHHHSPEAVDDLTLEEPGSGPVVEGPAADTVTEISSTTSNDCVLGDHETTFTSDEKESCHAVCMRVSSKHLILASPVFRSMFKVKYKEGLNLHSQGHAELLLPEDNPAAFLVILYLIHGQPRKVPRKITLDMLTELAILVDKYELSEPVEMFLDYWLQDLTSTIPLTLNDDLLPWICISWVFKKSEIFKKVTKLAQMESEGLLEADQLPISEWVLRTIDQHRQNTLTEIFAYLQSILDKYKGSERICHRGIECDGMILGSLTIGLNAIDILQPPHPPYNSFSVKEILQKLQSMPLPQYCNTCRCYERRYSSSSRTCEGVKGPLEAKLESLRQQLQGIELAAGKYN